MNIFPNQNCAPPYLSPPPPPYTSVYNNGNSVVITNAPTYPSNFLPGHRENGPFIVSTGSMPSPLDCLCSVLGQIGICGFFQESSIGLVRRTMVLQLRNQNGQPLMSIQHTPGLALNNNRNRSRHRRTIQLGSVTKFCDASGRVIMLAAEGDGGSTVTTVSSGDFILGFVEQAAECCGLCCPDEVVGPLVGKNGNGEYVVTVHKRNGGEKQWGFMDTFRQHEVGVLSSNVNGSADLQMMPEGDPKVKAIMLNLAFCMYMRHFTKTLCGQGQVRCNRILICIVWVGLLVPIFIYLVVAVSTGRFKEVKKGILPESTLDKKLP